MKRRPVIVALSVCLLMFASVPCGFAETTDDAIARTICLPMDTTASYILSPPDYKSYYATAYNGTAYRQTSGYSSVINKTAIFSKSAYSNKGQCKVITERLISLPPLRPGLSGSSGTQTTERYGDVTQIEYRLLVKYWTP